MYIVAKTVKCVCLKRYICVGLFLLWNGGYLAFMAIFFVTSILSFWSSWFVAICRIVALKLLSFHSFSLFTAEMKKSRSFASTLKRRFQRSGGKKSRSQSADRASSSMREGSLLRPPSEQPYRHQSPGMQGHFILCKQQIHWSLSLLLWGSQGDN